MGVKNNVGLKDFPKQGMNFDKKVKVWFNYDADNVIYGIVLRDDVEEPFQGIIILDDGRVIRTVECQWTPA